MLAAAFTTFAPLISAPYIILELMVAWARLPGHALYKFSRPYRSCANGMIREASGAVRQFFRCSSGALPVEQTNSDSSGPGTTDSTQPRGESRNHSPTLLIEESSGPYHTLCGSDSESPAYRDSGCIKKVRRWLSHQ